MKRVFLIAILSLSLFWAFACPICERNQPKLLRGITHGAGPESQWDLVIVVAMAAVVCLTLFFSAKWLVRPGERSADHIKRFILTTE